MTDKPMTSLPEQDPTKPNTEQGLYCKFDVRRTDGSDQPGGKHDGCEYFVLDMTHDPHSRAAVIGYARSLRDAGTHPELLQDTVDRWVSLDIDGPTPGIEATRLAQQPARGGEADFHTVADALLPFVRGNQNAASVAHAVIEALAQPRTEQPAAERLEEALRAARQRIYMGDFPHGWTIDRIDEALTTPRATGRDGMTSREERMVVIERDEVGTPTVWCDPEIADIVRALNAGGVRTVASCSGHGEQPGNIALADGRELVIANSYDEARAIERSTNLARQWEETPNYPTLHKFAKLLRMVPPPITAQIGAGMRDALIAEIDRLTH